jgi:hypothetical protein
MTAKEVVLDARCDLYSIDDYAEAFLGSPNRWFRRANGTTTRFSLLWYAEMDCALYSNALGK